MELSTASSIDEGCRNNSPPKPGLSRSSLRLPMLDMPTSDNPPPQQRRQTLGGRGLGREDSARGTGLLGTIRRVSVLDPMQLHPLAHQARGDDDRGNNDDVQNYHEVFQKLKQTFPTTASGALHQKTMARMAELKSAREHEEELEQNREEDERLRKVPVASNAFKGWVGKIGRSCSISAQQEPHDQQDDSQPHHSSNNLTSVQYHHHGREEFNNSSDRLLLNFIPSRSRPSILLRNFQENRRTSMDSGMLSSTSRSRSTNDEVNLARRKSITNLDEMNQLDDSKSVLSLLSDASGLLVDDEENSDPRISGVDELGEEEDTQNLSLQLLQLSMKLGGNPQREEGDPESTSRRWKRGGENVVTLVEQPHEAFKMGEDVVINEGHNIDQCIANDASDVRSTTSSMSYDSISNCSGASSSGLIVRFPNRRTKIEDLGDDLIVGFVNRSECTRKL
ncbi:hypothetical protein ACHAXA_007056 [Cyclostephanos tholiformis]|uniref:Uncharacterized protein n=1 Tax=Cyclostephanos tholiformis TaxID=382380 RepID=A0ABD3RB53_9STRA